MTLHPLLGRLISILRLKQYYKFCNSSQSHALSVFWGEGLNAKVVADFLDKSGLLFFLRMVEKAYGKHSNKHDCRQNVKCCIAHNYS